MVRPGKALFVSLLLALLAWATAAAGSVTRLAAVGDFGADATGWDGVQRETAAAALVRALDAAGRLAGVLALGDCNYPCQCLQFERRAMRMAPCARCAKTHIGTMLCLPMPCSGRCCNC